MSHRETPLDIFGRPPPRAPASAPRAPRIVVVSPTPIAASSLRPTSAAAATGDDEDTVSIVDMETGKSTEVAVPNPEVVMRRLREERDAQLKRRQKPKSRMGELRSEVKRRMTWVVTHQYYLAHLTIYTFLCLIVAVAIFLIERKHFNNGAGLPFVDCVFIAVSGITEAGLSTFDFSQARLGTQILVLMLIIVGCIAVDTIILVNMQRFLWKKPPVVKSLADDLPITPAPSPHGGHVSAAASSSSSSSSSMSDPRESTSHPMGMHLDKHRIAQYHALLVNRQEHDGIKLLSYIVLAFYLVVLGTAFLSLGFFFQFRGAKEEYDKRNVNVWWGALFHSASGFANSGLTLFPDSLMGWAAHPFPLLVVAWLIMLGNTTYPIALRWTVVALNKFAHWTGRLDWLERTTMYIRRYSRRMTVSIFPMRQTLILAGVFAAMTGTQIIAMLSSDWKILSYLKSWPRFIATVFQVVSTRTAGFNCVDLTTLCSSTLVMMTIMMYVSVVPNIVAMRSTRDRTKEKLKFGPEQVAADESSTAKYQLRRLLLFDATWLFAPWYLICAFEDKKFFTDPSFTPFKVLFEVASAYGTVGLSLGYTGVPYCFCGAWRPISKLILCTVMLIGRHRGFPDSIDQALIPNILPPETTAPPLDFIRKRVNPPVDMPAPAYSVSPSVELDLRVPSPGRLSSEVFSRNPRTSYSNVL